MLFRLFLGNKCMNKFRWILILNIKKNYLKNSTISGKWSWIRNNVSLDLSLDDMSRMVKISLLLYIYMLLMRESDFFFKGRWICIWEYGMWMGDNVLRSRYIWKNSGQINNLIVLHWNPKLFIYKMYLNNYKLLNLISP
jgi:hypothetical protein